MKRLKIILLFSILTATFAFADGLLMPTDDNYPKDFLRNRMTRVTVNIHGLCAETFVYQEFVNEWTETVDAVYSFPLPPEARATEFLYWRNDTTFKAILKVREQATNPGTGEGGIVAYVNKYIGRNGIKVMLKRIAPGAIQRVQLHYTSICDYYMGKASYRFPLDTQDFVKYPLDHLQFTFNVESNSNISGFDIPGFPEYQVVQSDTNTLYLELNKPKAYLNRNLEFWFKTDNNQLGVDFYSAANDTMDGHFILFVRPQDEADPSTVFPKRVIFVLSASSRMFGYKLDQSKTAIKKALDLLVPSDYFNIIVYDYSVNQWQDIPVEATSENIQNAKNYLDNISSSYGSQMELGLKAALEQIPDNDFSNSILVFTDGRSPIDPGEIERLNQHKAGIFPIGIGDDLDRARMEMTAALNYGFVTYFDEDDNLIDGMLRVFNQVSQPIMKDAAFEFGRADLYQIMPRKIPTTYAGSYFFMSGRYQNPVKSALAIAGESVSGISAFDFQLDFTDDTNVNKFAESLWAKEMIDDLERRIEIYGENPVWKDSLIDLSLRYNIRCRYTAYVADYETEYTGIDRIENIAAVPSSYLLGNYPNPFNPTTTIRFYLSTGSANTSVKFLKIYNSLGQLVAVIDISHLRPGYHSIKFNGLDFYGNALPSGLYFVRLEAGEEISTIRMTLLK